MALPLAAEGPSQGFGPASPPASRWVLAPADLLMFCFQLVSKQSQSSALSPSPTKCPTNHTGQAGNLADSEGHGERSLTHCAAFCHLVASTLFYPVPTLPHSTSPELLMPAGQRGHLLSREPMHLIPSPFLAPSLSKSGCARNACTPAPLELSHLVSII